MMRKTCVTILVAVLATPGCRTSRETTAAAEAIKVVVQTAAPADEGQAFAYSGTIMESETVPHSFAVTGIVIRVHVNEGDAVARGTLLAELDDSTYRRILEMAKAVEKQAEDAFNRLSRMYKNGNLPEIKYIEVETGLEKARAAAAIARKNVDDCRLFASGLGFVGKRSIDPGMVALPNLVSITTIRIDKVFARIPVPENDIALIHKGDPALIRIGALRGREFEGRVEDVGVVADALAHSYKIRIGIPNPDWVIKPGMVCMASIKGSEKVSGLVIPNQAVLVDETGRNYVYCLGSAGTKASVRYVKLGELLQNGIRIVSGLSPGERIVVSGQHELVDGAVVQVVEK